MKKVWICVLCVITVGLVVFPFVADGYMTHLVLMMLFYTYMSCAWNIVGGLVGQISIGHAFFFGIGAYTSTLLFVKLGVSPWIGMLTGGVLASVAGYLMGMVIFRYGIRGVYFAMVTLAVAEIARIVATQVRFLGGSEGMLLPLRGSSFWDFQFGTKVPYYYIALSMVGVILIVCYGLKRSRYYYGFLAVRADEEAANAVGIDPRRYKLLALVISAFFTALSGTFYAQYFMYIEPETVLGVMISVDMIIRPIIGGLGTFFGPVVGSFLMTPLGEVIRSVVGTGKSGVHLLIYGVVLVGICIWMPRGILSYFGRTAVRSGEKV
jgi:branched-chain amino acid transport system permease protein